MNFVEEQQEKARAVGLRGRRFHNGAEIAFYQQTPKQLNKIVSDTIKATAEIFNADPNNAEFLKVCKQAQTIDRTCPTPIGSCSKCLSRCLIAQTKVKE